LQNSKASLGKNVVFCHQVIHIRPHEAAIGVIGGADNWFPLDIEARIDDYPVARLVLECPQKLPEARIGLPVYRRRAV